MRLGFVMGKGSAAGRDLAVFADEGAGLTAVGAGLVIAEVLGLLGGGIFEGAGEESAQGGPSDGFHVVEGDIESGSVIAPLVADDDFAPALGKLEDAVEILGRRRPCHKGTSV
jgi:hypothetical protein